MSRSTLTLFILLISFGILFAGCSNQAEPEKSFDEFTFSDMELAKIHQLANSGVSLSDGIDLTVTGSGAANSAPAVLSVGSASGASTTVLTNIAAVTVDQKKMQLYTNIRTSVAMDGVNVYRVNNAFLNVRQTMNVSAAQVGRLVQGDIVTVLEIPNAEWAKVKLSDGKEGYVAVRYLARLTTEERLAQDKKQFDGQYFVNFSFLNMRKDPTTQAEKVGELPGQSIVKPLSMNGEWARVKYNNIEGYVSSQYLKPFLPAFQVREENYTVPILRFDADDSAALAALSKDVAALKTAGKKVSTLKALYDVVVGQESRDTRLAPGTVILIIDGVNARNVKAVTDTLQTAKAGATLFIETKDVSITGITEKMLLTMLANGNDVQSAGHTGDDLRSMTDSQVMLELAQSKKLIEDVTKREVYAIAYAHGGVNDRVMKQAGDLAYLFGIGQSPDRTFSRTQFLRLPTLPITSGMTPEDVVKLVK